MKVIEQEFKMDEPVPTHCSYCKEKKKFLMLKPLVTVFNNEIQVNVNLTGSTKWICLKCFFELDAMGHTVDIQEYE